MMPLRDRGAASRPFDASGSDQHLYLSALSPHGINGTVYEFALTNGVPATTPDRALHTPLFNIDGLAIGPDGDLYVAGTKEFEHNEVAWVAVWGQGASENLRPIRSLKNPRFGGIAVDANGYLYVFNTVYRPGAMGNDKPLRTLIGPPVVGLDASVAVDGANDVFLDGGTHAVGFANPVSDPRRIAHFCWKPDDAVSYAISIGSDGTEYVATNDYGSHTMQPGAILAFSPRARGCNPVGRITTTDTPLGIITGLLAAGSYLYALDYGGSLVVLDPSKGAQIPIERITTPPEPWGLAIGP